jgi:hypothetical protein
LRSVTGTRWTRCTPDSWRNHPKGAFSSVILRPGWKIRGKHV